MNMVSKAIPVTGHRGPYVCEKSRVQHFLDKWLIDGGKIVRPTRRPLLYPPGKFLQEHFLVLISLRG
jgi:hypothetical protein